MIQSHGLILGCIQFLQHSFFTCLMKFLNKINGDKFLCKEVQKVDKYYFCDSLDEELSYIIQKYTFLLQVN